jgi:hypothetical protein
MTYNEVLEKNPRFIDWDLEINGKSYQVIRYDGYNSEDYVCFEITPFHKKVNDHYEPEGWLELYDCHGVRGNAPTWEIKQSKSKTFKTKWGDTRVRFSCVTTVYRNGVSFFQFAGDEDYAYHKAKATLVEVLEGPINFHSRWWKDELINRKIKYDGQSAIIKRVSTSPFSMWIEPVSGKFSPPSRWDHDDPNDGWDRECWNEEYAAGLVVENPLNPSIDWFPRD